MKSLSRRLLDASTRGVIISAASLLLAFLEPEDHILKKVFEGVAFYGTILTQYIFIAYLISALLLFIAKKR